MTQIKFAHIADCHVGSWREPNMRKINLDSFCSVIDDIISSKVEFLLIAGDLFNTAVPSIDALKIVTKKLKEVHDAGIKVYGIAGSHDYSASGKSMLEVLGEAHVFENVMKGKVSEGTLQIEPTSHGDIQILGVFGKRGTLEKEYYDAIDFSNIDTSKPTIFMFHSAIVEFRPVQLADMDAVPLSYFPKDCIYYAGGHVHYRLIKKEEGYGTFAYPGPSFPNSFSELADLGTGSYIMGEINGKEVTCEHRFTNIETVKVKLDATGRSAEELKEKVLHQASNCNDRIVLIEIFGEFKDGKVSDIGFNDIYDQLYAKGAKAVIRNTAKINSSIFEEIHSEVKDKEDIESQVMSENLANSDLKDKELKELDSENQLSLAKSLAHLLHTEKKDGETSTDFEERVISEFKTHI